MFTNPEIGRYSKCVRNWRVRHELPRYLLLLRREHVLHRSVYKRLGFCYCDNMGVVTIETGLSFGAHVE